MIQSTFGWLLAGAILLAGGWTALDRRKPFCLTEQKYYDCQPCPDNAICVGEIEFVCKKGFIQQNAQCIADKAIGQRGTKLAHSLVNELQKGCLREPTLSHAAGWLQLEGWGQLEIESAMRLLRSAQFQKRNGVSVDKSARIRSEKKSGGACVPYRRGLAGGLAAVLVVGLSAYVWKYGA